MGIKTVLMGLMNVLAVSVFIFTPNISFDATSLEPDL
jgi:hypothetical protein